MAPCESVYQPKEDSTMLEKWVRRYARGRVLDIGTGSGIQAIAAACNARVTSVIATDVSIGVIKHCKKCVRHRKIRIVHSDLFDKVPKRKYDTIIFNPPYLPREFKVRDIAIEGGKHGYELVARFLGKAAGFLKKDGIILMVFSSLTKKEAVHDFIRKSLLEFVELERQHFFFEDIYVYVLKKSTMLKKLEKIGVADIGYFGKGRRGILFQGKFMHQKVVIKVKNPQSLAIGRIENEVKTLKKLIKHDICPRVLLSGKDFFVCKHIQGDFIMDYDKKSKKQKIVNLIRKVFLQLLALDRLKLEKGEMHRPYRHIIVQGDAPFLVDFERTRYSRSPGNVTQFCHFLATKKFSEMLAQKGILINRNELINAAKEYKVTGYFRLPLTGENIRLENGKPIQKPV